MSKTTLERFTKDNTQIITLIKQHDAIIVNGEGTLHGLNPAPDSLLYLAYIAKTHYAKQVQILNHSAYPQTDTAIDNTSAEAVIYKLVYGTIDYAAIREPVSLATMQKLDVHAAEAFDCLPIYIKDHYQGGLVVRNPKLILLSGSAAWLQLNIPSAARGNIHHFAKGLGNLNGYLASLEQQGYQIKFLYGANAIPAKDDREFLDYIHQAFDRTIKVYRAESVDDWLNIIASAAMLISGRFHHTIAAACLRVPYIALNSNTPKMSGLLQILDPSQAVLRYDDDNLLAKLSLLTNKKLMQSLSSNQTHRQLLIHLYQKAEKNFIALEK